MLHDLAVTMLVSYPLQYVRSSMKSIPSSFEIKTWYLVTGSKLSAGAVHDITTLISPAAMVVVGGSGISGFPAASIVVDGVFGK